MPSSSAAASHLLTLLLGAALGVLAWSALLPHFAPGLRPSIAAVSLPAGAVSSRLPPLLEDNAAPAPSQLVEKAGPAHGTASLPPPAFDAASYLSHLAGPAGDPRWGLARAEGSIYYDPWPGASRGAPWREFTRSDALRCIAARGGIGFIGDSVQRETVNALLLLLGAGESVSVTVPHAQQQYLRDFEVSGNASATARVAFRFATSLHPAAGAAAAELLALPVRALVVASGFWDLNPGQGGGDDASALSTYAVRLARFLRGLRSGPLPEGTALVWRSVTPIAYARAPVDRRDFLSIGRTTAVNALARRLLGEAWQGRSAWAFVDAALLMPPGDDTLVGGDGYHPEPSTLRLFVYALLSELCPPPGWQWGGALDALAME